MPKVFVYCIVIENRYVRNKVLPVYLKSVGITLATPATPASWKSLKFLLISSCSYDNYSTLQTQFESCS